VTATAGEGDRSGGGDPSGERAPDTDHTSAARLATAAALRDLGNALVAHQPDDGFLARVTEVATALRDELAGAPARPHSFHQQRPDIFDSPPSAGGAVPQRHSFPDCVISGQANPMGVAARLWREGDEAVLSTVLGPAFEGAPGRAHGGIVAALIDETMGLVLSISGQPAYIGRLAVTYRAPAPLGVELEVRGRLSARQGRKLTITAELRHGGEVIAEAEGLFIAVDPDSFFAGLAGTGPE
jgi:acyl-coenzyme A thioesterase PaaI-like protein